MPKAIPGMIPGDPCESQPSTSVSSNEYMDTCSSTLLEQQQQQQQQQSTPDSALEDQSMSDESDMTIDENGTFS